MSNHLSGLFWNEETRQLEFADGEAVGHRTLEQARADRAKRPMCEIVGHHVYAPLDDTCIHCGITMPSRKPKMVPQKSQLQQSRALTDAEKMRAIEYLRALRPDSPVLRMYTAKPVPMPRVQAQAKGGR